MNLVYKKPLCLYLPHQNSSNFSESGLSDFLNLAALVNIISVHSGRILTSFLN